MSNTKATPVQKHVTDFVLMTIGTLIMVVGIYFFKYTNNFSTGGVSGISVILGHYFPSTPGTFGLIINVILLLCGYIVLGKSFGIYTTYVTLLQSGLIWVLERVLPMSAPMTNQPFLELIFAVSLPAIGSAILFHVGASSGGTDIIAMIMRKYTTLDIGRALLISDCVITFAACFAFGMTTGLFSILGLVIMKRGATRLHGEGIYTHEGREVILTVVNRRQGVYLRRFIRATDPSAFLLITNTSEIIGNGFRGVN